MSRPCNKCGQPIIWGCREQRDANGKRVWVPLDPEPSGLGIVDLIDDPTAKSAKIAVFVGPSQDPAVLRYTPHTASCSAVAANQRRRERVT